MPNMCMCVCALAWATEGDTRNAEAKFSTHTNNVFMWVRVFVGLMLESTGDGVVRRRQQQRDHLPLIISSTSS